MATTLMKIFPWDFHLGTIDASLVLDVFPKVWFVCVSNWGYLMEMVAILWSFFEVEIRS
jgi:hypothetical protein